MYTLSTLDISISIFILYLQDNDDGTQALAPPPPPPSPSHRMEPTTAITIMTTPLSPTRQSRFKFHSDINAPNELKEFSAQAHKRHAEFRKRVNALDHNVAGWMNRLVQEVQSRENEMVTMYDYAISEPLERCAERFMRRMDVEFETMQADMFAKRQQGVTKVTVVLVM
jgi:hypothetical protein